jgi:hypothetical protein
LRRSNPDVRKSAPGLGRVKLGHYRAATATTGSPPSADIDEERALSMRL